MDLRSIINKIAEAEAPTTSEWTPTPEQEKWLGGADRQDPNILSRMPGSKPPVTHFADPADQALAKQLGFPDAAAQPTTQPTSQAAQPVGQDKIAKLNQLVAQFQQPAQKPSQVVQPTAQATQGQAAQPAASKTAEVPQSVVQNQDGTFTLTKKDGTKIQISQDGKPLQESKIANSLIESFGYNVNEDASGTVGLGTQLGTAGGASLAKKFAGKTVSKVIPGVGSTLSAFDAYNRWKEGDRSGAVIAALAGVGWLVPGPLGWAIGGGLDAANLARDYKAGKFSDTETEKSAQPQIALSKNADPKIVALQKYLVSQGAKNPDGTPLTIDGIMGPNTRAAMDAADLTESQKIELLRLQLEALNEVSLGALAGAAKNIGKNFASGLKGGGLVQPMVKQARGGAIAGKVAPGARTAQKAGAVIAKNPKKIAAAGIGAGVAAGLGLSGKEEPVAPTDASKVGKKKTSGQAAQPNPCAGKEELVKQIQAAIADLKTDSANNPNAAAAIANAEKAIASCSGQAAQPAAGNSTPLQRFYSGNRRPEDLE